ncbi:MAG: hypothetical protein PVH83_09360, partial [Methyloceanibacter sp.]
MTDKQEDLIAALDALEDAVERPDRPLDSLLSELATLLLGFSRDSFQRPRVHRMLGIVYGHLGRDSDAVKELHDARELAKTLSPPNYRELGQVARALSAICAASGEDRLARDELVSALTFTAVAGQPEEVVRLVEDVAHSE